MAILDPRKLRHHTGTTEGGHVRDLRIERVGSVTIYKRGQRYYLYYRSGGKTIRRRTEGNLASARVAASRIQTALQEGQPNPLGFERVSPERFVVGFLDYSRHVANHALRTRDRYRAALELFQSFCEAHSVASIDRVTESTVEDFVKWLRSQTRARNGASAGKRGPYHESGIRFILSTCRTATNWAMKHRHLPPYAENPFSAFPLTRLRDRFVSGDEDMLTREQAEAFFRACDDWQRPVFVALAVYGLRVGELTHLLIEDVDLRKQVLHVRSKPELLWHVKTSRERILPLFPEMRSLFEGLIGDRKVGFVFLNRDVAREKQATQAFRTPQAMREHMRQLVEKARAESDDEKVVLESVTALARELGQIPEKRIRQEFMKLTKEIGCPWLTRAHSLRHFFASYAQEAGMNPLLVQSILGHATLEMTAHYTHLNTGVKRQALQEMFHKVGLFSSGGPETG